MHFRLALCTLILDDLELAYFKIIKRTSNIAKVVTDTMIVSIDLETACIGQIHVP